MSLKLATRSCLSLMISALCAAAIAEQTVQADQAGAPTVQLIPLAVPADETPLTNVSKVNASKVNASTTDPNTTEVSSAETVPQKVMVPVLPKLDDALSQSDAEKPISQKIAFQVDHIIIKGATVFTSDALSGLVKPYIGRKVTMSELHQLRQKISERYVQLGYINSGVIIPDQKIKNNTVIMQAIEGGIESLVISGNNDLKQSYLSQRVALGTSIPLNIRELKKTLNKLQFNPLIQKVDARLSPGSALGLASLDIAVTEAPDRGFWAQLDNYRSPNVGAEGFKISYGDNNISGYGDALGMILTASEGLRKADFSYAVPVNARDTYLHVNAQLSDSKVVEAPFDALDIESENSTYSLGLSRSFNFDGIDVLSASANIVAKDSEAFLFDEPFSFSQGAIDGASKTTVLELELDWTRRTRDEVSAATFMLRRGLDAMGANQAADDAIPDGTFTSAVAQFQYARRLPVREGSQMIVRFAAQRSADPLLAIEKFSIGGHSSVRGYRENQLVRDNGLNASLEFRYPIFQQQNIDCQIAPFFDWGHAWDKAVLDPNNANTVLVSDEKINIYSLGAALLWRPTPALAVNVTWAEALEDETDRGDDDLQSDGIHVSMRYSYRF